MNNLNIKKKMSRWDYDVVFYRVFCVTLVAVAFTFIVILTNVFVDIDELLTNKKKHLPETSPIPETIIIDGESPVEEEKEQISNEYKNYDSEINPSYRTKRFIESQTIYDAKSPVVKKMLTRRLATLLKELDDEEAKNEIKLELTTTKTKVTKNEDDQLEGVRNEDLLHLGMHNIILQGLVGHMDLNDVYKKVHVLVRTFNERIDKKSAQDENPNLVKSIINSKEILKGIPDDKHNNYNEEHQFLNELIKCKELEERISNTSRSNEINATNNNLRDKDDKLFIKTVIEINESDNKSKAANRTHLKENIEGLVKLIYNGKSIKINQMDDELKSQITSKSKAISDVERNKNSVLNKNNNINTEPKAMELNNKNRRHTPNPLLNRVLEEYLKKNSLPNFEYLQNSAELKSIKNQRLKRQIKIKYSNNITSPKINSVHEGVKKEEDDLYIEIETHYDGKGIEGEKKKKLVRSLIDKIQKALHSDIHGKHDNFEHIKFVKRTQDPIYSQNKVLIDKRAPMEPIEHRLLDPIGKTLETHENIADRLGDTWKKQYYGPNFLSISKAVNSAEMNEVNVEYDSVLKNGIPKRLQKPLHTDLDDEGVSTGLLNSDSSNVTLLLKDIDGSGFSIGFNQYEGEPPDKNSMKMFNGIENLIREYHQTYDENDDFSSESPVKKGSNLVGTFQEMANRNVENLHKIHRRSITEVDANYFKGNIFKIFFKEDPSVSNYLNIFKRPYQKLKFHNRNDNIANYTENNNNDDLLSKNPYPYEVPIILDERILNKKLKPSELLTIANLVNRKRRSVYVKRISNLKSKIKLNRYLNTKTMETKKVFMKNKRNKRQVNNIRIIARDPPKASHKNSDENIFSNSKENSYSDKETMIRAVETAKAKINYKNTEEFDEESPFNNIYRIQNPYSQTTLTENLYNTGIRSNELMSKYPHIFLDKSFNSNDEIFFDEKQYRTNVNPYRIKASTHPPIGKQGMEKTTELILASVLRNASAPKFEEMVDTIMPPVRGTNYRITVKMSPKNKTNTNAGFKEVHTSVNKSYDDNGLRYYTLLNVSQISKIEKLNKTDEIQDTVQPLSNDLIDQQNQIKMLLKLHKNRVDLQLNNLFKESNHLQKMIESNKEYNLANTIKLLMDDNGLRAANEDKLISDSVRKLQETYTESKHLITTPTSSKSITILPSTTETATVDKIKIIDTAKQNEQVTFQILKKIDTNTQILQAFLEKLSDRLNFDKKELAPTKTTEKSVLEMKLDLSKDWKSHGVNKDAFYIPNELKNDTMPFVYAYQQSIPMKSKTPQSLASLVYHGHLHANAVQNLDNDNFKKPAPRIEPNVLVNTDNSRRKFNESKFFIDEINDFKTIPTNDHVIAAKIKINTTNIV